MYIIDVKYKKSIDVVDEVLPRHLAYLDRYYAAKKFICSGRKIPRIGGVILCNAKDRDEVNEIIHEDPFYKEEVANYEIMEFEPVKYAEEFKPFL